MYAVGSSICVNVPCAPLAYFPLTVLVLHAVEQTDPFELRRSAFPVDAGGCGNYSSVTKWIKTIHRESFYK